MPKKFKKIFILYFLLFFLFFCASFVLAQGTTTPPNSARPLEITYPEIIRGIETPVTVKTPLPIYIRYLFYFFIAICGVLAFGSFFYAGFRYLTSAGDPSAMSDAKSQMLAALLGLLILLGSYLILYNINPELTDLKMTLLIPEIPSLSGGVWLCKEDVNNYFDQLFKKVGDFNDLLKQLDSATNQQQRDNIIQQLKDIARSAKSDFEEINKRCYLVGGQGNIKEEFNNEVSYVVLVPERKKYDPQKCELFGAFLFEEEGFKGNMQMFYAGVPPSSGGCDFTVGGPVSSSLSEPSSVIPFILNENANQNHKVVLYGKVEYNKGVDPSIAQKVVCDAPPTGYFFHICDFNFHTQGGDIVGPESLRFEPEPSDLIAVLVRLDSSGAGLWEDGSEVFIASDPNLLDNERITREDCSRQDVYGCVTLPDARSSLIFSAKVY